MRLGLQIALDLHIDHAGGSSPLPESVDMELRQ